MVATVLRLRYRILGNTLVRRPWQLVGFCIGLLWALWALVAVVAGFIALNAFQGLDVARAVAVLGGSALVLGWTIGPVLVAGTESTVDARRLAPFPLTTRQIMFALAATGLTGIPGIVTSLGALASVVLWLRWPAAAVIAIPSAALGVLICVVASRLVTTLSTGLGGHRRGREIFGTILLGIVIMTGPIITGILALLSSAGDVLGRFAEAAVVLGWTPIGAAWAVPGDAAAGEWLAAVAKFVIAAGTLAALWLLWGRALKSSVSAPPRQTARTVAPGRLGFFAVMPTGGVGATWARSLTAWLRDPRYLRQLIFVPLFPVLFAFTTGIDGWLFSVSPLMVALILSIAGYADISYDGTAFASVLSTGVSGRADRLGRLLGAACVGVPAVIVVAIVTAAIAGTWTTLPAVLAAALGILLAGYGVSAVSSALLVVPVAKAGDSPFKTVPGQTFVNGLVVFLVLGVTIALAAPALVLAIVSTVTASAVLAWIALAVAVVAGAAIILGGIVVGGRTLERTGPDLLARIKAFPS